MALKLPTVFALVSVVPLSELVVSRPVVPKVPVPEIVPLELAVIAPEVLPTAAFTTMLLGPTLVVRLTVREPPAITAAPIVSPPAGPFANRTILPLAAVVMAPLVVRFPTLVTDTLPPP